MITFHISKDQPPMSCVFYFGHSFFSASYFLSVLGHFFFSRSPQTALIERLENRGQGKNKQLKEIRHIKLSALEKDELEFLTLSSSFSTHESCFQLFLINQLFISSTNVWKVMALIIHQSPQWRQTTDFVTPTVQNLKMSNS